MEKMTKTEFELSLMELELHEPEIMQRMREGKFTKIESLFLIIGIVNCLKDRDNDKNGYILRMQRVSTLVDQIWGLQP